MGEPFELELEDFRSKLVSDLSPEQISKYHSLITKMSIELGKEDGAIVFENPDTLEPLFHLYNLCKGKKVKRSAQREKQVEKLIMNIFSGHKPKAQARASGGSETTGKSRFFEKAMEAVPFTADRREKTFIKNVESLLYDNVRAKISGERILGALKRNPTYNAGWLEASFSFEIAMTVNYIGLGEGHRIPDAVIASFEKVVQNERFSPEFAGAFGAVCKRTLSTDRTGVFDEFNRLLGKPVEASRIAGIAENLADNTGIGNLLEALSSLNKLLDNPKLNEGMVEHVEQLAANVIGRGQACAFQGMDALLGNPGFQGGWLTQETVSNLGSTANAIGTGLESYNEAATKNLLGLLGHEKFGPELMGAVEAVAIKEAAYGRGRAFESLRKLIDVPSYNKGMARAVELVAGNSDYGVDRIFDEVGVTIARENFTGLERTLELVAERTSAINLTMALLHLDFVVGHDKYKPEMAGKVENLVANTEESSLAAGLECVHSLLYNKNFDSRLMSDELALALGRTLNVIAGKTDDVGRGLAFDLLKALMRNQNFEPGWLDDYTATRIAKIASAATKGISADEEASGAARRIRGSGELTNTARWQKNEHQSHIEACLTGIMGHKSFRLDTMMEAIAHTVAETDGKKQARAVGALYALLDCEGFDPDAMAKTVGFLATKAKEGSQADAFSTFTALIIYRPDSVREWIGEELAARLTDMTNAIAANSSDEALEASLHSLGGLFGNPNFDRTWLTGGFGASLARTANTIDPESEKYKGETDGRLSLYNLLQDERFRPGMMNVVEIAASETDKGKQGLTFMAFNQLTRKPNFSEGWLTPEVASGIAKAVNGITRETDGLMAPIFLAAVIRRDDFSLDMLNQEFGARLGRTVGNVYSNVKYKALMEESGQTTKVDNQNMALGMLRNVVMHPNFKPATMMGAAEYITGNTEEVNQVNCLGMFGVVLGNPNFNESLVTEKVVSWLVRKVNEAGNKNDGGVALGALLGVLNDPNWIGIADFTK